MTIAIVLLSAALLFAPVVVEAMRRPVRKADRDAAPGKMVSLPMGKTYVRWRGESGAPAIVLIHGLTTPSPVFDALADGLVGRGARTLTYDHFGRGLSDNVPGAQDASFFTEHLTQLLDAEAVTESVVLVGYSMGGAIAAAFADLQPDRVRSIVLLAPAGLNHSVDPVTRFCRNAPVVGDIVMILVGPSHLRRGAEALRGVSTDVPDIADIIANATLRRGYMAAVLSSLRNLLGTSQAKLHRRLSKSGLPVLAIWGKQDQVIPIQAAEALSKANPNAEAVVIEDGDHGLPFTHSARLTEEIARFSKLPQVR